MKTFFEELQLRAFNYRDCKYFESDRFRTDELSECNFKTTQSDYFGNLNDKNINDNKTFWKTIKPFLSDKVTSTNKMKKLFWMTIILPKLMCRGK